jgi:antirestriction protein ArdC
MSNPKEIITEKFLTALQAGTIPWQRPWNCNSTPKNLVTKRPYTGINNLILSIFGNGEYYLTFRQIASLGGYPKKGSRAYHICFYKTLKDEESDKNYRMLRYYNVFSALDVEGITIPTAPAGALDFVPHNRAEELLASGEERLSSPITYGSDRAFYTPASHTITLPSRTSFVSIEEFYCCAFHEIGHSLKEPEEKYEPSPYSYEELCAEIFACFILNDCNLLSESCFRNSQGYVQGWAKKLESDPGLLIKAASHASKRFEKLIPANSEAVRPESDPEIALI